MNSVDLYSNFIHEHYEITFIDFMQRSVAVLKNIF